MKILMILVGILLPSSLNSAEYYRVECGRDSIMFPAKDYPLGLPLSNREICRCSKNGFRGARCDMDSRNEILLLKIDRKNDRIIDELLRGIKEYGE